MSIGKIAPPSRGLLRLHGWLLVFWVVGVGVLTSATLLHLFNVHSMAVRYAVGAAAVYFLGFVLAGWWYAKWWNLCKAELTKDLPVHATVQEQLDYDQAQEKIRKKMEFPDLLSGASGDDPLSFLLAMIGILILLVALLFFAGYLPLVATDAFAGYLAEIVLEFVIGGFVMRRVLKPRLLDDYWRIMIGKTWLAGLLVIVVFGSLGFALQQANPKAKTLLQVLRN